jgi:hypothetical protein
MSKMRTLRDFNSNKSGIFWVVFVAVAALLLATVAWVVCIVITQNFFTSFSALPLTSPITIQLGANSILAGSITIVVIWIGLISWMILSAFKKESQEGDVPLY